MSRSHGGTRMNGTYTPEMNCSTTNGSVITATPLRAAERGRLLAAMPSSEQAATPRKNTQVNVHQADKDAGSRRW